MNSSISSSHSNNHKYNKKKIQSYIIEKDKLIGQGSYAIVCLSTHHITNHLYVAKIVSKSNSISLLNPNQQYSVENFQSPMTSTWQMQLLNKSTYITLSNIKILSSNRSELQIIKLFRFVQVFETTNNIYIIQQYCEGGTLRNVSYFFIFNHQQLLKSHKILSQADALHCLKCLCLGFTEIIKNGIIHRQLKANNLKVFSIKINRDLKPQNILMKENELKIADFGFAKKLLNHRQLTKTALGSPFYMAPQLLKGEKYSSKCDIWSIGVIYYELLFGSHPWIGNNIYQLLSNIKNNQLYFSPQVKISQQSQLFLIQTLQFQQKERISWLEIFQHRIWKLLPSLQEQNEFQQISSSWRKSYLRSAQKLNKIAQQITIQELIYVFLQLKQPTLNFQQFKKVILWLEQVQSDDDIGTMYELFDKDCNGVIDVEEFVGSFGFTDGYKQPVKVIQKLLEKKISYEEMKKEQKFKEILNGEGFDANNMQQAYLLIRSINV